MYTRLSLLRRSLMPPATLIKNGVIGARHSSSNSNTTPRNMSTAVAAEPFLNGSTSNYVEEMYNSWLQDPKSVHAVRYYLNFIK